MGSNDVGVIRSALQSLEACDRQTARRPLPAATFLRSLLTVLIGGSKSCHNKRVPRRTPHSAALAYPAAVATPRGALMSSSTPAPGDGLEPEFIPLSLSDGGDAADHDNDNDGADPSPLLDLLQRFPDFFHKEVLERLDPTARASLAGAGSAFREAVYPRSIFPFGLPALGGAIWRLFKLTVGRCM